MKEILDFLAELSCNNNREWFNAHKDEFMKHQNRFHELVEEVIKEISIFDPSIANLTPKDCTYRMNRDIRFSADKSPYKTHFSAFIAPRGKNSGLGGYYLHLEPRMEGSSMIGHSILAVGEVCLPPVILRSIREEIIDNGEEMLRNIASAEGFRIDTEGSLKRTPTGFPSGTPYDELLRLKDHCLVLDLEEEELYAPNFTERIVGHFRSAKPYLQQLNRAIEYGYEEMM